MNNSSNDIIQTLLADLGWSEVHAIPIANEENRKLLKKLDYLHQQICYKGQQTTVEAEKVKQLDDHMNNVQQGTLCTSTLCSLRNRELEEELNQLKLYEREIGRLKEEANKLRKLHQDVKEKSIALEALEEWMKKIEEQEADMTIMKKYIREDNSKLKDLDLEVEHLIIKVLEKKNHLDRIYTKVQTDQVALDRVSSDLSQVYAERSSILTLMEAVNNKMRNREEESKYLSEKLSGLQSDACDYLRDIDEQKSFLKALEEATEDIRYRNTETNSAIAKTKSAITDAELQGRNFSSELESLHRVVDRVATELEVTRAKTSHLKKEKLGKVEALQRVQEQVLATQRQLETISQSRLSAEQLVNEADARILAEESEQNRWSRYLTRLTETQFKVVQEHQETLTAEKSIVMSCERANASLRNVNSKLAELDKHLLRYQEMLYKSDFHSQQLEVRVENMKGIQQVGEERNMLEEKIKALSAELENRVKTVNLLTLHLNNIRRDANRRKLRQEELLEKCSALESRLQLDESQVEIAVKEKEASEAHWQQLMVERNLQRLKVKSLMNTYRRQSEKVYSLEAAKADLDQFGKDHWQQIELHQKMLTAQERMQKEENAGFRLEITTRRTRVERLIKRYEIKMSLMAPPEGEETRNQAFYIIRAAQEKDELQNKGDVLDTEIQRMERELVALENTLTVMNGCNSIYRHSNSTLSEDAEEFKLQKELEEEIRELSIKIRHTNDVINELRQAEQLAHDNVSQLTDELQLCQLEASRLISESEKRGIDTQKQVAQLDRARHRLRTIRKKAKEGKMTDADQSDSVNRDIEIRMLRELVDKMSRELVDRLKADESALEQGYAMLTASGLSVRTRLTMRRDSRVSQSGSPGGITSLASSTARSSTTSSLHSTPRSGTSGGSTATQGNKSVGPVCLDQGAPVSLQLPEVDTGLAGTLTQCHLPVSTRQAVAFAELL